MATLFTFLKIYIGSQNGRVQIATETQCKKIYKYWDHYNLAASREPGRDRIIIFLILRTILRDRHVILVSNELESVEISNARSINFTLLPQSGTKLLITMDIALFLFTRMDGLSEVGLSIMYLATVFIVGLGQTYSVRDMTKLLKCVQIVDSL